VLLLGFRRAEHFRRALAQVRKAAPKQLFVALDGPRPGHPQDMSDCADTARVLREIDWPCQMNLLRRGANLGCRAAVSGAVTWAFQHVEELIIIEEDCIVAPSFFRFAAELLERYRDEPTIGAIAAANFQQGQRRGTGDYYVSKYPHCWGWATWRRAWRTYRDELPEVATVTDPRALCEGHGGFVGLSMDFLVLGARAAHPAAQCESGVEHWVRGGCYAHHGRQSFGEWLAGAGAVRISFHAAR
jgi:hypothetical protein